MKKNLVYIVSSLVKAGPENVLFDTIRNIKSDDFKIFVIALRKEESLRSRVHDFERLNITLIKYNFSKLILELAPWFVAKKIEESLPDPNNTLIHAHCYHPVLVAGYLNNYLKIATIHNISIEDFTSSRGQIFGRYMSLRFNNSLKKIDHSVVISDYMYQYYKDITGSKISKISNGVSVYEESKTDAYDDLVRWKNGINKKIVLVLGRLSKRKNVNYIIDELSCLKREDFICLFLGIGEELENCKEKTKSDKRFIYKGYKPNVLDYLMIADYYVSASFSEGLPLSVLEAVNVGIPCLLSNIPPHKEITDSILNEGVRLFSIEKGELSTLFVYMMSVQFDTESIKKAGYDLYSSNVMSDSYVKLYEELFSKYIFTKNEEWR